MSKVQPEIRSTIREKTYYLITHPDVPDLYIENYGDRQFKLKPINGRWTEFPTVSFGGDFNWEITRENILRGANHILEERLAQINKAKEAKANKEEVKKYHWGQCQTCGAHIGLIGRFFHFFHLLHKCPDAAA